MTRRETLRRLALAAAAIAVSSRLPATSPPAPSAADALVIGAGVAGLAAARLLADNGLSVILLEARDQIGGRLRTDRSLPGLPLDLGPAWIHGATGNPLSELARRTRTPLVETDFAQREVRRPGGILVPPAKADDDEESYAALLERLWKRRDREDEDEDTPQDRPLLDEILRSAAHLPPARLRDLLAYVNTEIEHEYAAAADELSFLHWDDDEDFPGPQVMLPLGYDRLLPPLAHGLDIRTGVTVHHIRTPAPADAPVTVETSAGPFTAPRVLVTLPLGVLQSGSVQFHPPLPAPKRRAIARLGMGLLNKIILVFRPEDIFWPPRPVLFDYVGDPPGQWAEWVNWHRVAAQPALIGFNAAHQARALEKLDDSATLASATRALRSMFGLPRIPDPVACHITRWASDPFTLGSYSYLPVGATPGDRDELARPVRHHRLHFAGEATSRKYPSSVHGALLSGQRAARAILET